MKRSTKRMISILICLALTLAILPVAAMAADTVTAYCQAPAGWTNCKAYWWGSSAENPAWPGVDMSQDANGIWGYDVPVDATGLIFNDGNGTQTQDLTVPADENNMYVFENQYWAPYGIVSIVRQYFVAGNAELCGVSWDPGAAQNKMTENTDGTYSITFTGVPAGNHELKVTTGSWATSWGTAGTTDNYVLTVEANDSTVIVSFDPAAELVNVVVNPESEPEAKTLVGEGTATYATDADAWDAEGVTFVPAEDGTVTVEIIACNPGFYLDVYENDEWIEEHFASSAQKIEISVTAGATYEFLISSAAVYSSAMFELKAGSVTYKVTANVAAGEPSQGGEDSEEGGETSEENPQPIGSYYGNYIGGGQTVWFVFDNYLHMVQDGVYSQMLHISAGVPYAVTYRGENVPVDAEGFVSYEMADMQRLGRYVFSVTNNGSSDAFFTIQVNDRPAYVVSGYSLVLGDNSVVADAAYDNTLYEFAPDQTGIYTFTISEGVIGNWGTVFNPVDNTETKASTLEWTCTAEGQSILIGVAQMETAVLTVAKTGDYVEGNQVPETVYENTYRFDYQLPENPDLVEIDVLDDKADVAVLDGNNFYRYGSKYGPLMVTDLSQFPINLEDAILNGQLRAYVYENGEVAAKNNYNDAMTEYLEAGLVPVTKELAMMLQQLGDHHDWWKADGFIFDTEAPADESTAWMVACSWVKGSELDPEDDNSGSGNSSGSGNHSGSGNNSGNSNPKTADISVAWAVIAIVVAGICLIVMKKKENFFLK